MRYDTGMTATCGHVNSRCLHFMYVHIMGSAAMTLPAVICDCPCSPVAACEHLLLA